MTEPRVAVPNQPRPPITVLIVATHVGTNLFTGQMAELLDTEEPDLVLCTELQSPRVRARIPVVFPRREWVRGGTLPPSLTRSAAGTIAFAHRARYRKLSTTNRLVSRRLDPLHPVRRTTLLHLEDRANGEDLLASPMHTWSLGLGPHLQPGWRDHIREQHTVQVNRYAAAARAAIATDCDAIMGGDVNEWVTGDGHTLVEKQMRAAGMVSARLPGDDARSLVEAWVSPCLEVTGFHRIPAERVGADHQALRLRVRRRA